MSKTSERSGVFRSYLDALTSVEAVAVLLSMQGSELVNEALTGIDGILFTGGEDVWEPGIEATTDHERDEFESLAARFAIRNRLPILGVCRGMHLVNVVMGGANAWVKEVAPNSRISHQTDWANGMNYGHDVNLSSGSHLQKICGTERIMVNGVHSRCVVALGSGLQIAAQSDDGIIEAFQTQGDWFCLGVQWHPEALINVGDPYAAAIFRTFKEHCSQAAKALPRRPQASWSLNIDSAC